MGRREYRSTVITLICSIFLRDYLQNLVLRSWYTVAVYVHIHLPAIAEATHSCS